MTKIGSFYLTIPCLVYILSFCSNLVHAQQNCEGLDVLYPKTDSIIDKTAEGKTTYLILGNTASISKKNNLKEVSILHENNGNEVSKQVWTGQDEISKVSAIQQDLSKLVDTPGTYWFRVSIEQDGTQCQLESGRFSINQ
ncbi:unnamed protein product [Mucor hiemalis]